MTSEIFRAVAVVTPEGVPLSLPLAGRWERAMAFSLDFVIIVAAGLLLFLLQSIAGILLVLAGLFLLRNGYFILWELVGQGATPGKRVMGLRVAARDGGALTTERILARNMVREVEIFLPLTALAVPQQLLGTDAPWLWFPALSWVFLIALFPLLNREGARLGDLLAGTVVIAVPRLALQADQAAQTAREKITFTDAHLAIYGEEELETLASILRTTSVRKVPGSDLRIVASTIARKIGYEGDAHERRPLDFLRAFYRAQRASLEHRLLFGSRKVSKRDPGGAGRGKGPGS